MQRIPETFLSMTDYMKSFKDPLIEEAHADLFSNMTAVRRAPVCYIHSVEESKNFNSPKTCFMKLNSMQLKILKKI